MIQFVLFVETSLSGNMIKTRYGTYLLFDKAKYIAPIIQDPFNPLSRRSPWPLFSQSLTCNDTNLLPSSCIGFSNLIHHMANSWWQKWNDNQWQIYIRPYDTACIICANMTYILTCALTWSDPFFLLIRPVFEKKAFRSRKRFNHGRKKSTLQKSL